LGDYYRVMISFQRGGWYGPRWVETLVIWRPSKRPAREIIPHFQQLKAGGVVPDWGPTPFHVAIIQPQRALVYDAPPPGVKHRMRYSWALTVEPLGSGQTRLLIRFRASGSSSVLARIGGKIGGLFDYLTIVTMVAGLRQRLKDQARRA
jgi:hypothetical protein